MTRHTAQCMCLCNKYLELLVFSLLTIGVSCEISCILIHKNSTWSVNFPIMKNVTQCISSGKSGQTMPEKHAMPSAPVIRPDLVCSLTFQISRVRDEVKRKSKRHPPSLFHTENKSKPLPCPQPRFLGYTHTSCGL